MTPPRETPPAADDRGLEAGTGGSPPGPEGHR